jgi:hypothetical protein
MRVVLECGNAKCAEQTTPAARYQTERYGRGVRVHNVARSKPDGPRIAGCVVCGHFRTFTDDDIKRERRAV